MSPGSRNNLVPLSYHGLSQIALPGDRRVFDLFRGCWSFRPSEKTETHSAYLLFKIIDAWGSAAFDGVGDEHRLRVVE